MTSSGLPGSPLHRPASQLSSPTLPTARGVRWPPPNASQGHCLLPRPTAWLIGLVLLLLLPVSCCHQDRHGRHYRRWWGSRRELREPLIPLENAPALPPPLPPASFFPFLPYSAPPQLPPPVTTPAPAAGGAGDCGTDAASSSSSPHPTAPANISYMVMPIYHSAPLRSFLASHRLLTILLPVVAVLAVVLAAVLVYLLTRHRRSRRCFKGEPMSLSSRSSDNMPEPWTSPDPRLPPALAARSA